MEGPPREYVSIRNRDSHEILDAAVGGAGDLAYRPWSGRRRKLSTVHEFLVTWLTVSQIPPTAGKPSGPGSSLRETGTRDAIPESVTAEELSLPNPPLPPGPILTLSPEEIARFFV